MGLTDEERRRLDALASEIEAADPRLARALSGTHTDGHVRSAGFGASELRLVARVLLPIAVILMTLGLVFGSAVLFVCGFMPGGIGLVAAVVAFVVRHGRRGT